VRRASACPHVIAGLRPSDHPEHEVRFGNLLASHRRSSDRIILIGDVVVSSVAQRIGEAARTKARLAPLSAPSLLACLVVVARHRGIYLSVPQLIRDHLLGSEEPSIDRLLEIARKSGLRAVTMRVTFRELSKLDKALPSIVLLRNGGAMVLLEARDSRAWEGKPNVVLQDPNASEDTPLILDEPRFTAGWTGQIILIKRDYSIRDEDQPFGLKTFVALLLRDRRLTRDVVISAFIMSVLALAPILFWRLLIDTVLYYKSLNTLWVLCVALAILIVFETAFGYLRRYLVLHVTQRIDVKLSTDIFDKVLNIPIDYFERTPVGQITRDMWEIWKIRRFLTIQLFGTVLDASVIFVILPILFFFSAVLTAIVLVIYLVIGLWLLVMLPVIRRKGAAVHRAETVQGSFLVESLHGIRTIKSLGLDARRRHEWDVYVTQTEKLRFDEGQTANLVRTVVLPLERLMTAGVFALGVYFAISTQDQVYVGALVAFMMLTMRLVQPLTDLATLLPEYDEAQLAVRTIAKMVNQPPEEGRLRQGVRTPMAGRIEFSEVHFRYSGATVPALSDVSFVVPEGTIFGIMGRSGSGKTTVTRLVHMLHSNYQGLIKIDANDLRAIDLDHLRASIAVVLQENFLFRGTIRETISAAKPDATFDDVIRAARLAGAEEFIEQLPLGYDTWIAEGSANLSGGQRQRLAIARALITDPRILILDEATSALDAESEAIINANLKRIARDRTLMIISHRLASLVEANTIMVLERGRVYDMGRHDELLARCDIYRSLWHQQHRHILSSASHETA
jgi:ATP-binding cassette subfamily B protein